MKSAEVQSLILKALGMQWTDRRLGRGVHYLAEQVRKISPEQHQPRQSQILEAYWSLVVQGLAYFDISQHAPENWTLELTDAGAAALRDEEANPNDPSGYLTAIYKNTPGLSDFVRLYINEAVHSYYSRCYLSCTVMLGVAAEACLLEVAEAFLRWRGSVRSDRLDKLLTQKRASYIEKFTEFRKRLEQEKAQFPGELRDGLDIHLGAVLDLLRMSRNDAGHPTGREFHRDDCFTALRVFERLVHRMYALKRFFEDNTG